MIELLTVLLGALVYSISYLYCLGLRIVRQKLDDKASAVMLGALVSWGVLTATVTLEAVFLIGVARPVSGSLFYIASALGALLAAMSVVGVIGMPKAIAVAMAHRRAAIVGTWVGNVVLLVINLLCFAGVVPSVL